VFDPSILVIPAEYDHHGDICLILISTVFDPSILVIPAEYDHQGDILEDLIKSGGLHFTRYKNCMTHNTKVLIRLQ